MAHTIDRLQQDHFNIAKLLLVLERELAVLDAAGTPDYDILLSIAEYFQTYPDQDHHVREDLVYRRLLQRNEPAARSAGDLQQEHRDIAQRVRKFNEVLQEILNDAIVPRTAVHEVVTAFIEDQRRHMRMEEEHFFPAALGALTDIDWLEIDGHTESFADPLFGPNVDTRFAELHQTLQAMEPRD